jgi:hypothetical protein
MGNAKQYSGRYGRLTVRGRAPRPSHLSVPARCRPAFWECACDCGKTIVIPGARLANGQQSCGCEGRELSAQRTTKHGRYRTPEHNSWSAVRDRCCNPKNKSFPRYGGRGIKMCQRWRDSFEAFYADMGDRPSAAHSIERKDVNGDYEPFNCIWATPKVQGRNRRNSMTLTARGRTMQVNDWAETIGIKKETICSRLRLGWSAEDALFTPTDPNGKRVKNPSRQR